MANDSGESMISQCCGVEWREELGAHCAQCGEHTLWEKEA